MTNIKSMLDAMKNLDKFYNQVADVFNGTPETLGFLIEDFVRALADILEIPYSGRLSDVVHFYCTDDMTYEEVMEWLEWHIKQIKGDLNE